jgi:hypothetical protein
MRGGTAQAMRKGLWKPEKIKMSKYIEELL